MKFAPILCLLAVIAVTGCSDDDDDDDDGPRVRDIELSFEYENSNRAMSSGCSAIRQ